jgi:glycosyltransferase involved in cell wall biosynthesis
MKKVFFVIPALAGGGAERVMLHLLKNIDRSSFHATLIVFKKKGRFLLDLPPDIEIKALTDGRHDVPFPLPAYLQFARLLRTERPDAVVSFMWYANHVVVTGKMLSGVRCGIIVSERYSLSLSHEGMLPEYLRRLTVRFLYPKADAVVVNSANMGGELLRLCGIPDKKVFVIHNPVDIQKIRQMSQDAIHHPWYRENIPIIIAIGRLTQQKGFSFLLQSVHLLKSGNVPCRIVILGEGREEKRLKKTAEELDIQDSVDFLGFQHNPYGYLARADLYVLPSLYEGFPNALLEAMALGVPAIATRCPTGPDEIITDGENGLLVPPADATALAQAIKKLLLDNDMRKKFSEEGKKRAEAFAVKKIMMQYEDVIEKVCAESAER